ncbi:SRPBCC family protein [Kitasatospora sp. A2-31]|uniref:SRPBCC family protein n=1 Tax=Kitasatospora sp. A2-31 TaxID=2916414 RepID=UPI001EEC9CE6|nr:SRPBCC family protein [Kitasatospora sp. A2-31]MCG6495541.1 SRPBCC family protein [Kitasatospora sp. A2-31]
MTVHTIDETAPAVVRLTTTIHAPLAAVWSLHTDIDSWAAWLPDVDRAHLEGPLTPGASFRWQTHGLDITSTVLELVPGRRIVWGGPADGIDGIHVWTFEETDGAVTVRTEESWAGAPVEAQPAELEAALRASLEAWLDHLKAEAERR